MGEESFLEISNPLNLFKMALSNYDKIETAKEIYRAFNFTIKELKAMYQSCEATLVENERLQKIEKPEGYPNTVEGLMESMEYRNSKLLINTQFAILDLIEEKKKKKTVQSTQILKLLQYMEGLNPQTIRH